VTFTSARIGGKQQQVSQPKMACVLDRGAHSELADEGSSDRDRSCVDYSCARALAPQDGPTVLVAHSWGGTVLSEVGIDPKVTALVYVAARAPDAGEDFVALSGTFPAGPVRTGIQRRDGFTTISEEAFLRCLANGVDHTKAEVLYAVQEPTAASLFGERTTAAAWHSKPSWYAVSKLDQTINPDLERFLAKRMNATTVELNAGHLSLVSHPKEIADLILAAAGRRE